VVTKPDHAPGPGRSTSDAAFNARKKEIAQRNEQAQKEARKLRATREEARARGQRQENIRWGDPLDAGSLLATG
jgi:hypothetical protein